MRRDTPPMSPAAQRRERRMPQVPADAFPRRAKGRTTKSLRPSALPAPGLPSHISYVSEAGRATLFVYRVGHAVPSAFVSDAVPLCSVCCLTSSPAFPRRLDRSAAPGGSVRVPPPFASKTDPEPPRAPFSPNTYPAWGAEHPRAGARRAPRSSRAMRNPRDSSE